MVTEAGHRGCLPGVFLLAGSHCQQVHSTSKTLPLTVPIRLFPCSILFLHLHCTVTHQDSTRPSNAPRTAGPVSATSSERFTPRVLRGETRLVARRSTRGLAACLAHAWLPPAGAGRTEPQERSGRGALHMDHSMPAHRLLQGGLSSVCPSVCSARG